MSKLGATWNQIFHEAPADAKLTDNQKMIVDRSEDLGGNHGRWPHGCASTSHGGICTDQGFKHANLKEAASITVALRDDTVLTIRRESVEIKIRDVHLEVSSTGAPAMLMWWPGGKMAGTVQHEGRFYSIRHMGGELLAVVEMSDERMPEEHAPISARLRANDPNLRDDTLLREGDASKLRPLTWGMRLPSRGQKAAAASSSPKKASANPGAEKGDIVIDVIVAYTKKAASYYADVKRELVELSIEEANASFRISGLGNIKLRLVHAYETNYVERR